LPKFPLTNLHGGMNRHQQPEMLPPNILANAIGVDMFKPGLLRPLPAGRKLSSGISGVVWSETAWVNGVFTLYYTTSSGLYRCTNIEDKINPGTLLDSGITGRFSVDVLNNVAYIAASQKRLRDDRTSCTAWGISRPATRPSIATVAMSTKVINACESTSGWTVVDGTLSLSTEAAFGTYSLSFLAGTSSTIVSTNTNTHTGTYLGTATGTDTDNNLQDTTKNFSNNKVIVGTSTITNVTDTSTMLPTGIITTTTDGDTLTGTLAGGVANYWQENDAYLYTSISTETVVSTSGTGMRIIAYTTGNWNLNEFAGGSPSTEQDYIELHIYYLNIKDLTSIIISFDCNDGSFTTDGYYYLIPLESVSASILSIGAGQTSLFPGTPRQDTPHGGIPTSQRYKDSSRLGYSSPTPATDDGAAYAPFTTLPHYDKASHQPKTRIRPGVQKQTPIADNSRWIRHRIHKSDFVRYGATSGKDWSTVRAVMIMGQAASKKAAAFLIDNICLAGGGKHQGQYYGMCAFAVRDVSNNTLRVSGCSDVSAVVEADQQKLIWTVTTSTDPQVNQRLLFIKGGLLEDWFCVGKINNNTDLIAETNIADWEYQDGIENYYDLEGGRDVRDENYPRAFTRVIQHQDRMVGFGIANYENYMYFSCRTRGDDCPELHGIAVTHQGEKILNAVDMGNYIHVRSDIREYRVAFGDPQDIATVDKKPIDGDYAGVGPRDAAKAPSGQLVGVGRHDIIASNGYVTGPLAEGLIDLVNEAGADLDKASVCAMGRYLYVSLPTEDGDRTLIIDFIAGAPRPVYIWDRFFSCLSANVKTKRLYGIYGGDLWELLGDYGWREANGTLIVGSTWEFTTAKLGLADFFHVDRMRLNYLGDMTAYVYLDGKEKAAHTISATTETEKDFGVATHGNGRFLEFKASGTATEQAQPSINLPIMFRYAKGEDDG